MKEIRYSECRYSKPYQALYVGSEYRLYDPHFNQLGIVLFDEHGYYKFVASDENARKYHQKFISYVLNSLNNCIQVPKDCYVYVVYVDKSVKYIGKGSGNRFQHTISGTSHVYQLNKAYFGGSTIEVFGFAEGVSDEVALLIESSLIKNFGGSQEGNLFNSRGMNRQALRSLDEKTLYDLFINTARLLGAKVSDTGEYEFCRDFYENQKFHFENLREHEFV